MVPDERDCVVELHQFSPQPTDVSAPLILGDESRLTLAYYVGGSVGEHEEDRAAIVFFPRYHAYRSGTPNGDAARWPGRSGVFEVKPSSWIAALERANDVDRRHDSRTLAALRHLVFAFPAAIFECLVPRWDARTTTGTRATVVAQMQRLLRRERAPVVALLDRSRGRELPTTLYLPPSSRAPLVVFAHGWFGHPRKFTRLFAAWADAGIAVAAPAFPLTNDESPLALDSDDVVNQPRDVSFVLDELLSDEVFAGRFDPHRVAVAGFSLGAVTALATGFHAAHRDERVRAVASLAGRFTVELGPAWEMREKPLLVVHGQNDRRVPYAEGRKAYEAGTGPKVLLTFAEQGHDVAEDTSPVLDDVIASTTAFWRRYLLDDTAAQERLLRVPPSASLEAVGV